MVLDDEYPWDDDWDWDETAEPAITYREAIEQLRSLCNGRADVRIDWNGKRDACIVFTGTAGTREHRVRFESANQLDGLTRLISSATLLADCHALWFPGDRVIIARLVGDYGQFHAAVAGSLAPSHKDRRFAPDTPIGRDVAGILASSGAFAAAETPSAPGSPSRSMRLIAAGENLKFLYQPHSRAVPSLAIELAGFVVSDAAQAEEALVEYGPAYLFELDKATGASLRIWRPEYRLGSRRYSARSGVVSFPLRHYDPHFAELYMAGNSPERDPAERYLKYYQVLEFYMPRAAASIASSQGSSTVTKATSPIRQPPNNQLAFEMNQLDAVISLSVTPAQILNLLSDKELFTALSDPKVIQDVQVLGTDTSGQLVAGRDYRAEISVRSYGIRCRIVHMKEGGGRHGATLLAPYSREARDLAADLRIVQFLAEHTLEYWSRPIP